MDRPVVVYDGECRFCRWSVARIQRLDRAGQFEYLPRQAPGAEDRFPLLKQSDFNTGLRLLQHDPEIVHVGADGVYQIYRRLQPLHRVAWLYRVPVLTWLYRVPVLTWLFRLGYAIIARNRHRFGRVSPEMACDDLCDLSYGERRGDPPAASP